MMARSEHLEVNSSMRPGFRPSTDGCCCTSLQCSKSSGTLEISHEVDLFSSDHGKLRFHQRSSPLTALPNFYHTLILCPRRKCYKGGFIAIDIHLNLSAETAPSHEPQTRFPSSYHITFLLSHLLLFVEGHRQMPSHFRRHTHRSIRTRKKKRLSALYAA